MTVTLCTKPLVVLHLILGQEEKSAQPLVIALTQISTRGAKFNSTLNLWSILDTCTPDF